MKKGVFSLIIAVLAIFYCFVIENSSRAFYELSSLNKHINDTHSTIDKASIADVATLIGQSFPIQITINQSSEPTSTTSSFKKIFKPLWIVTTIIEEQFKREFLQYKISTSDFLIRLLQASLLFPTHYFW